MQVINGIPQPDMPPVTALQASIQAFENMPDPSGKRPKGRTPQEIAFYSKLVSSQLRIGMMPKMPVTVVNLNPYDLVVNNPLWDGLKVKANKNGEKYSALVIRDVKYTVNTGIDRNHTPEEYWPIQLASEFETQYQEKGGCFFLHGDLGANPELEHTTEFKAKFKKAESQFIGYCRRLKATGDSEWNTPNRTGARNIHTTHRQAAQILFDRKLVKELPLWMQGDVLEADVTDDCPICRQPTKRGQLLCACNYVLDVVGAFKAGAIEETSVAFERLTRPEVVALGVSAYVAETKDEKPARLAEGRAKPLSLFEVNQQRALARELKGKGKGKAAEDSEEGAGS